MGDLNRASRHTTVSLDRSSVSWTVSIFTDRSFVPPINCFRKDEHRFRYLLLILFPDPRALTLTDSKEKRVSLWTEFVQVIVLGMMQAELFEMFEGAVRGEGKGIIR